MVVETLALATALGLVPCFTPVRSPESNGVSEAFVKTLERDYARVQPRPDADPVLARIGAWITDCNEHTSAQPTDYLPLPYRPSSSAAISLINSIRNISKRSF